MAIRRSETFDVAAVEINNAGGLTITVVEDMGGYRMESSTDLTRDEAAQFAQEITDAVLEADVINHEGDI